MIVSDTFFPEPFLDSGGFLIAGLNSNETIAKIQSLTGIGMNTLTLRCRPYSENKQKRVEAWKNAKDSSRRVSGGVGFIKDSDILRDVLIADNTLVLARGLSHQKVAEPLLIAMRNYESMRGNSNFEYRGRQYQILGQKTGCDEDCLLLRTTPE